MRYSSLDSIRGIAATIVVIGHAHFMLYFHNSASDFVLKFTPINIIIDGRMSVIVFFVLSGLVLTYAMQKEPEYGLYLVRRLCRIYLPFLAVMIAVTGLWFLCTTFVANPYAKWNSWGAPETVSSVARQFLMLPIQHNINPPGWTLATELKLSILFPAILFLIARSKWSGVALLVTAGFCSKAFFVQLGGDPEMLFAQSFKSDFLLNTYYVEFFAIGCALALTLPKHTARLSALPGWLALLTMLVAVVACTIAYNFTGQGPDLVYAGIGAVIIGLAVSRPRYSKALATPVLAWLGRISYSLYLVHVPIIFTAVYLGKGVLPIAGVMMVAVPMCFLTAHFVNRWIEIPAMGLGRRLSESLKKKVIVPAV